MLRCRSILIAAGRVGMWLVHGLAANQTLGVAGAALAPPPLDPEQPLNSSVRAAGLFIAAQPAEAAACWRWLNAVAADPSNIWPQYPARRSAAQASAFADRLTPEVTAVYDRYAQVLEQTSLAGRSAEPAHRLVLVLPGSRPSNPGGSAGTDIERRTSAYRATSGLRSDRK
ncbi:MAG: hypothetical protein MI924_07110 [Chloroflexales bacterium]|nr:hypothetical protein [Chloroflexales bacterium]